MQTGGRGFLTIGLVGVLVTDLLGPLAASGGTDGPLVVGMAVLGFAGLLGTPFCLLLGLGPQRWFVVAVVTQFVLGALSTCGGVHAVQADYLEVAGRPVRATVSAMDVECGEGHVGPASDRPASCVMWVHLERPDGTPVAGGPIQQTDELRAAVTAAGDGPITVREDRLGLVRAMPAEPGGEHPALSARNRVVAVLIGVGWLVLLGSLAAGVVRRRRVHRTELGMR